ncbi:protein of unknown function (plasmid) [Azospirillum baldaniorum]|uniref:Uncharacterized protein n=1 Tax=Azospirillum baldaniorum TaxID=1064539 RepID=A0A9P1JW98_9PROT|nr:protein of unknown function [Azospirillum baldaniorum]
MCGWPQGCPASARDLLSPSPVRRPMADAGLNLHPPALRPDFLHSIKGCINSHIWRVSE